MFFYRGRKVYHRLSSTPSTGSIFSVDKGSKRFFLCFDSVEFFEEWYYLIPPEERTFNEVIKSDKRKLVIDIDTPAGARGNAGDALSNSLLLLEYLLTKYDWVKNIKCRIEDVFNVLDIGYPEIIIYNMCGPEKLSYHAVVSNFAFDAHTCLGLCKIISFGQIWEDCVDTGIYKRVQCIRVEDSTKFGEKRWKTRIQKDSHGSLPSSLPLLGKQLSYKQWQRGPNLGNLGSCQGFLNKGKDKGTGNTLRSGLISNLDGTVFSDIVCTVSPAGARSIADIPKFGYRPRQEPEFLPLSLPKFPKFGFYKPGQKRLVPMCNQRKNILDEIIKSQFTVRKVCNRTIFLRRVKPGFCIQCNRVHSRENAIMKYTNGMYSLFCWRWMDSNK